MLAAFPLASWTLIVVALWTWDGRIWGPFLTRAWAATVPLLGIPEPSMFFRRGLEAAAWVLATALLWMVSLSTGHIFVDWLRSGRALGRMARLGARGLVGACLLGLAGFGLGLAGLLGPLVEWGTASALVAWSMREVLRG